MSLDWVEGRVPKPPIEDVIKAAVGVETEGYTHQLHFYYPSTGGVESIPAGWRSASATSRRICRPQRAPRKDGWLVSDGQREKIYERIGFHHTHREMADMFEGVPQDIKALRARPALQLACSP